MVFSPRQLVLASLVVCISAMNAYAGLPDEALPTATADPNQAQGGGDVSVSVSVYALLADRSLTINCYPVLPNGDRGPSVGTYSKGVPQGYSFVNTAFGPLPSGTYIVVAVLTDSKGNVKATGVSKPVTLP